jgi:hypothetical protein
MKKLKETDNYRSMINPGILYGLHKNMVNTRDKINPI